MFMEVKSHHYEHQTTKLCLKENVCSYLMLLDGDSGMVIKSDTS